METLFTSPCVNVKFVETTRHLTICAKDAPIDAVSVSEVLRLSEVRLAEDAKFSTTWDLRMCHMPPVDVTSRCIRWALKNKNRLDSQNERLVVLGGSRSVNGVVHLLLPHSRRSPSAPVRCRRTRTDCARACGAVWVGRWVGRRAATSLWYLDCSSGLLERHLSRRNAIITAMQANALTVERGRGAMDGATPGRAGPATRGVARVAPAVHWGSAPGGA